jgi:hypothetical protein
VTSPDALRRDYMTRLHRCLRGVSPDIAAGIEQEIATHIDDALAAHGATDEQALEDVLDRLGPPEDYAPDMALYLMVDRGYRDWSIPHMVRSAAFWGLSTLAGAVAVLAFGGLYLIALLVGAAGLRGIASAAGDRWTGLPRYGAAGAVLAGPLERIPPVALLALGVLGVVGVTVVVRWFIGQYVRRARPHAFGMRDAGSWSAEASRRIVLVAGTGVVLALAGLAVQAWALGSGSGAPGGGGAGVLLLAGLGTALLAPVLGLLWTAWAEGP